jgi:hypothetical protein
MKCIKCDRKATYDSPDNLCDEHWVDWWFEGDDKFLSPDEVKKEKQDLLNSIWKQHGKPED